MLREVWTLSKHLMSAQGGSAKGVPYEPLLKNLFLFVGLGSKKCSGRFGLYLSTLSKHFMSAQGGLDFI